MNNAWHWTQNKQTVKPFGHWHIGGLYVEWVTKCLIENERLDDLVVRNCWGQLHCYAGCGFYLKVLLLQCGSSGWGMSALPMSANQHHAGARFLLCNQCAFLHRCFSTEVFCKVLFIVMFGEYYMFDFQNSSHFHQVSGLLILSVLIIVIRKNCLCDCMRKSCLANNIFFPFCGSSW